LTTPSPIHTAQGIANSFKPDHTANSIDEATPRRAGLSSLAEALVAASTPTSKDYSVESWFSEDDQEGDTSSPTGKIFSIEDDRSGISLKVRSTLGGNDQQK
jgi:hypothetical protein